MNYCSGNKDIITTKLKADQYEIAELTECTVDDWNRLPILKSHGFKSVPNEIQLFVKQIKKGIEQSLSKIGPVLIVSHGGVYYALCYLLNAVIDDWKIDNCAPVKFYLDSDNKWKLEKLNC